MDGDGLRLGVPAQQAVVGQRDEGRAQITCGSLTLRDFLPEQNDGLAPYSFRGIPLQHEHRHRVRGHPGEEAHEGDLPGAEPIEGGLPGDGEAAGILHQARVVPFLHGRDMGTPLRQVLGEARPFVGDIGPGLLQCQGQAIELPGQCGGVLRVARELAARGCAARQEELRRVLGRENVEF